MARLLDQPRYKCALSAMQTVQAIPRAIPVLHAGPGCASKLNGNNGTSGMYSPNIFPCTSVSEKEVVFGGEDKLRSTIENALKVIDADLFVVLTGCTSEIIGDDVAEVAGEFADHESGKTVIYANTPGFKENNYQGYDWVLQALFKQYLPAKPGKKQKGLVNIFSAPPMQDPFWSGNLRTLETLIGELGLTPNNIFGYGRGIPNIDKIPEAEYTVLVSPWAGLESARLLEQNYHIPLLHYPVLPIGAFETSKFLKAVGAFCGIDPALVEQVTRAHEEEYYYFIERFSDIFLEQRIMSKRFVSVCDAHYALAVTKFLVNDLGMFPTTQFITDGAPEEYQENIIKEFQALNYGIKAEVRFSVDGYTIHQQIRETDFAGNPLVIGSSWERTVANDVAGHFINIASPMVDRMVINSSVAGYAGGLKLLEDIYTTARQRLAL